MFKAFKIEVTTFVQFKTEMAACTQLLTDNKVNRFVVKAVLKTEPGQCLPPD